MITLWLPSFAFWGLSIPPYGSVPPESLGRIRALLPAVCTLGDVTFFLRFSIHRSEAFLVFITCSCWFLRPGFYVGPKTESLGCWKNLWGEVDVTYTLRPAQVMTPPSSEDFPASVWWPSCKLGQVRPSGSWCPPPCRPQGAALRSLCFCVVLVFIFIISLVISKAALWKPLT